MPETKKVASVLTPDNHAVILVDHQYIQLLAVRSHPVETVINNVTMLAKAAKIFKVPTLLTTVFGERQELLPQIQAVFPEQKPINRTGLNAWVEPDVYDWVQKTGKKKLVMAGLWTEVCLNLPTLSALAEGYEVYIVTDASGGSSSESHERGVQRMLQAGARPLTVAAYLSELQWDWAAEETADEVSKLFAELGGGFGQALRWEWQLLGLTSSGGH
ncbi:isochorismatase family protein [Rhizobium sp. P32RR-XVIII]|uniref:isochorismatase family protein n=1 Tax=Rhizobium sp. P32RR-XVIII TaxID=2726738 RepID=UPI001456F144|nr:isochorismatase family protein [Rhizobium sp. P32RR-XVIII]NLS04193.1 isochorismatase family protein [Rhizobium sp. P32RR-XVIII]